MLPYIVEGILLDAFVGGVAAFFARFGGSPIGSDELLYMQTALNNVENLKIANRFTHICLLKLFLWLSPNALTGARIMWAVEIGLAALLIYLAARMLGGRGSQLTGLIAVALFLSYPFIVDVSGGPSVDVTAMVMVAAFVTLYLYSAQHNHRDRLIVMALGLVFVLAFKAKETTIVTAVLFLGLGLSDDGYFDWRALKASALWCAGGIVLGLG